MPADSYESPAWSVNVFFYLFVFVSLPLSLSPSIGQEVMNSLLAADVKTDCGSELLLLFDCYRNMAQSLKECSVNVHAISQFNSPLSRLV